MSDNGAMDMGIASLALRAYGTYDAVRSSKEAAATKMAAAKFEADQASQQAIQAVAVSQRAAAGVERETQILQSNAIALAAASGGGAQDPTIMNIIANIGGEGAYRKGVALYEGEEQARQLRLKAAADIVSGKISANASLAEGRALAITGSAGMIKDASSLYAKYGYKPPVTPTRSQLNPGANPVLDAGTPTAPSYS